MASNNIPYMSAPGSIGKILEKIKEAGTPDTFNADFLSTKLGFKGGNYRTFISWAKKGGLLNNDGTPTQLYMQFRNPKTSKNSLAKALKSSYAELYSRNEYCHDLNREDFKGLVMEATGESKKSKVVELITSTFFNAKILAEFDKADKDSKGSEDSENSNEAENADIEPNQIKLGLNYSINLVLPKTDDPSVYKAIFKSLKENLLS